MAAAANFAYSLPYAEPDIVTILIQSSFLLLLNVVRYLLDSFLYCGLVGQILIGVIWGTPLSKWLDHNVEAGFVQLGYLGLILLVYEGGLATSVKALVENLALSCCVALTGILFPMGLSFLLVPLGGATPLQAFAAGAALSSTSLGTVFTILSTAGLTSTRLGTVLTSAAMMDDVVGLILIQIITSLGRNGGSVSGEAIGRPLGASLGLLSFVIIICWAFLKPLYPRLLRHLSLRRVWISSENITFVAHTLIIITFVSGGAYAGTSVLFAAFLAGSSIAWWDSMVSAHTDVSQPERAAASVSSDLTWKGTQVYNHFYRPLVDNILKPLFFASIGFSIPITQMFSGPTLWRSIIYALLMMFGKLVTGIWLLKISSKMTPAVNSITKAPTWAKKPEPSDPPLQKKIGRKIGAQRDTTTSVRKAKAPFPILDASSRHPQPMRNVDLSSTTGGSSDRQVQQSATDSSVHPKSKSLYPPIILGMAMVSRGEIGFLIASLAESEGIFVSSSGTGRSELYLYVVWATLLCTIIGPITVGILVRRVNSLEETRKANPEVGLRVLGVWGAKADEGVG